MLQHTSAHKRNFLKHGPIVRAQSSKKYTKVLSQLFPSKEKDEKGIKQRPQMDYKVVNTKGKSDFGYKYWDDPN